MIDPRDGALVSDDESFRIGPDLTLSEFRAAEWAQGATPVVLNHPWSSFKLDGRFLSKSLSFIVILYFEGERFAKLELCHSDGQSKSWADYSEAKEIQRKASHDAWLTDCLGAQRSFAWGTAVSNDGDDPHGGGSATIIITYGASPSASTRLPSGGSSAGLPPPPRQIRRRAWGIGKWYVSLIVSAFIAVCILAGIAATIWIPMRVAVNAFGKPVDAVQYWAGANSNLKGGSNYSIGYRVTFDGATEDQVLPASEEEFSRFQEGQRVPARALRIWNWSTFVLLDPEVNLLQLTFLAVCLLLVAYGLIALALWATLFSRLQRRRLVRRGTACTGTLTGTRIGGAGRGNLYYLSFQFKTPEGVEMTSESDVAFGVYSAARVGTSVTMLYDPARPKRSIAYEYCDYEVVPSTGSQRRIASDVAVDPEVKSLAMAGREIDAIRRYRSITGAGLKDAKEFVDRLL